MPASTKDRKFYFRAPDLEFGLNGPIKIGNIISGSGYGKGKTESRNHTSVNASLSTKLYDVFGGQAEAKANRSMKTIYEFDKVSALYLEKNPTATDAKKFCEQDDEFKRALKNGLVNIVTGLKIEEGLRYSNLKASGHEAALSGKGHVTQETTLEGRLERESGEENTGFMHLENEADDLEVGSAEVSRKDAGFFAVEQEFENVQYVDFEDEEGEWCLAVLE
ncbi:hypothetical protein F4810DRAFT_722920 [Camillea tinctor]|nr:hypothetical protein F4810DRAFT_722920 [Camillea tinctor]